MSPVPEATEAPDAFVIKLSGRRHTVPYRAGRTLLEAAKEAGLRPPSSCEDGFCGSCMAKLVLGDVHMSTHEALTAKEIACGNVLLCQAVPTSAKPLFIDYDASSFKIEGARGARTLPRVIGALVFAFVVAAVWFLRATG